MNKVIEELKNIGERLRVKRDSISTDTTYGCLSKDGYSYAINEIYKRILEIQDEEQATLIRHE